MCACGCLVTCLYFYTELLTRIACSSTPNPDASIVTDVWDYKKWLEPHQGKMSGHSKYHIFRFMLNASQKAVMHYKRYSSCAWEPDGPGIELLKVGSMQLLLPNISCFQFLFPTKLSYWSLFTCTLHLPFALIM